MAGLLHRPGQRPLVFGAGSRLPARPDSAVFGHIPAQEFLLLIINRFHLLDTEGANSTFSVIRTAKQIITLQIIVHSILLKFKTEKEPPARILIHTRDFIHTAVYSQISTSNYSPALSLETHCPTLAKS
jgi:hypothetical protein